MGTALTILTLCCFALALKLLRPKAPRDILSQRDFVRYILLNGNATLRDLVVRSFPQGTSSFDVDGNTILREQNECCLIYYAYKFGALSEEDVAKCYRLATKHNVTIIYALTNHSERKALTVTEYIPQRFNIVNTATIYKYLIKRGLIPSKEVFKHKKSKITNFFHVIINKTNIKYYLICGLSASLISLITPLKVYYLVFAFLNLFLGVLSLIFSERNVGKFELFKH